MKKILFTAVFAVLFTGFVFAETGTMYSKLSSSTQGLFKNDVDNFTDVNEWDTVKPENIFGAFGYDYNNAINFGLAKQFENYYLAGSFNGAFDSFNAGSVKKEPSVGDSSQTKTLKSTNDGGFNFAFLYGWKNMSLRFDLNYDVTNINNSKTEAATESVTNTNNFTITPEVYFGINDKSLKDWDADYYAFLNIDNNINRTKSIVDDDHETSQFNGDSTVSLGGGMLLQKPLKELGTQDFDVTGMLKFTLYPSVTKITYNAITNENDETKESGKADFGLSVKPKYTVTLPLAENMTFKGAVYGNVNFSFSKDAESYTIGDSDPVYYPNRSKTVDFTIQYSYIDLGFVYKFKKPFTLNLGAYFNLPSISLTTTTSEDVDAKGDVTNTTKTTQFKFNKASSSAVFFSSGFSFIPSDKFTLDCSCNFVTDLLSSRLSSNLSSGSGTSILNTANQILIHNFTIQLSMKL